MSKIIKYKAIAHTIFLNDLLSGFWTNGQITYLWTYRSAIYFQVTMGIIKDDSINSLNPSDYSEASQVQLSLDVDRNDYVIAGWREHKGSGSNIYLQYVTGVFPGCWCTLESSSKACWTIFFPDGGHPKEAMRAMLQKRNPDHSTWKDYSFLKFKDVFIDISNSCAPMETRRLKHRNKPHTIRRSAW